MRHITIGITSRHGGASSNEMKKYLLLIGAIILIIVGLKWYQANQPGKYDALAQCLTKNGVKMWGAYWCPHCQAQKKAFGNSFKYINYIECSLPGGSGQTKVCDDAKIEGYPTWENKAGKRVTGEQTFSDLAELGGCSL